MGGGGRVDNGPVLPGCPAILACNRGRGRIVEAADLNLQPVNSIFFFFFCGTRKPKSATESETVRRRGPGNTFHPSPSPPSPPSQQMRQRNFPQLQRPLLQVLQDASVAEVVDVAAQVHQLGVDVGGHAAVGGGGKVWAAGHRAGAPWWGALGPPLHQGTISVGADSRRGKYGRSSWIMIWCSRCQRLMTVAEATLR